MSVTLPGDGTVVATVNVGGEQQQVVQVSTLPAITGTVALDAASLAALESVSVGNFPATQPVSGTVALDAGSLAALETVSVANFPATQPVSGTVSVSGSVETTLASQPLPTGAATEATLAALNTKTPTVGQAAAAASSPVVLASDQTIIPVNTLAQPGVARQVAANASSGASTNQALTTTTRRISITARLSDIRFVIGSVAQTASAASHFIAMNERLDFAVPATPNIAVLSDTTTAGVLEVTELT